MIELRPDQEEALAGVLAAYHAQPVGGRALVVAPCGFGKTILFSMLAHRLAGQHVLIIAHRDELLNQAREKYLMIDPGAIVGKVGGGAHEYDAPVTVAGIDTISQARHLKNLHQFDYKLVIWDECHHARAPKYEKVRAALPDAFHLGVTATPNRMDQKSLEPLFGAPVFSMSILDAIQARLLCDVRAIAIRTETNLDGMRSSKNSDGETDFNLDELARAVDMPARNRRVADAYKEHAQGRRAICFGVTVKHAQNLAEAFNNSGIPAACVSGETKERAPLYAMLARGELKVITTVLVLTEGFDLPLVDCVIMARPTQSRTLFTQCIGRGLRLAPMKKDCLILDLTDNSQRLRLTPVTIQRALNLDMRDNETVSEALEREESEKQNKEATARRALIRKLNEKRDKDVALDLFALPEWQERENGMFVLEVGFERHKIALVPTQSSGFAQLYEVWARLAPRFVGQKWMSAQPLDYALQFAEKRARQLLAEPTSTKLLDKNAPWRNDPMSERQKKMLKWYRIPFHDGMTKGQAADLIDQHKEELQQRKQKKEARKAEKEGYPAKCVESSPFHPVVPDGCCVES